MLQLGFRLTDSVGVEAPVIRVFCLCHFVTSIHVHKRVANTAHMGRLGEAGPKNGKWKQQKQTMRPTS